MLTEFESKQLLAAYGLPTVETRVARNEDEAAAAADAIGYPVVVKLFSETITHKTDVGGVQLNLADADAVRRASRAIDDSVRRKVGPGHVQGVTVQPMIRRDGYEIIIGSSIDLQFGPVLLFGSGGQLVEVYKDRALALPPLNTTLARRMMEQTNIYTALKGVRGRKPIDLAALEQLLVQFSHLVVEQRWIKEIDINPLLASPEGLVVLDARVIAHPPELPEDQWPRPAIRPYPTQYVSPWTSKNGIPLLIRPIRPEDEPLLVQFHETLSERSVAFRYFHAIKLGQRVAHDRLTRTCFIDYDREMALVAEHRDLTTGARDPRRRPAQQATRRQRGRVRHVRRRPLPEAGARHRAAPPTHPGRPRREDRADHRRDPPREHRDAAHLPEARLPVDPRDRRGERQGRARPLTSASSTWY